MTYGPTEEAGLGFRTPRKPRPPIVSAALGVIVVASIAGAVLVVRNHQYGEDLKEAAYWTVAGPPCPAATAAVIAQSGIPLAKGFEMNDASFQRGYGDVSCREFHSGVSRKVGGDLVCQFTGPSALKVSTSRGDAYFMPGGGKATVAVKDGVARCVTAAHYKPKAGDQ